MEEENFKTNIHFSVFGRMEIVAIYSMVKLLNRGAEIGVYNGDLSLPFLRQYPELTMYLVDPYKEWSKDEYDDPSNAPQDVQDARYELMKRTSSCFGDRAKLLRMTSMEAVKLIEPESLDFVYIDANHHYKYILEDLREWGKRVRNEGLIMGHDFSLEWIDVINAVNKYCLENDIHYIKVSKCNSDFVILKKKGIGI